MTPKEDLFLLIKSLTKSEKRYFNLFAKRHIIGGENKYIRLFKCIEALKEYDEDRVKQQLKIKDSVTYLASEKTYLKELILKSLKQFHEKNSINSILHDRIVQIEILFEKGLFKMGYEIIDKSLSMAQKYQKFLLASEILMWKINYDVKLNNFEVSGDVTAIEKNTDLFKESLNYMLNSFELVSFYQKLSTDNNETAIKAAITKFKNVTSHGKPGSDIGAYYYYSILAFIGLLEQSKDGLELNFKKAYELFKENKYFIEERPNLYLISASNYIVSLIQSAQYNQADLEIDGLQQSLKELDVTDQIRSRAFLMISDNRLRVLLNQSNNEKAKEVSKDVESGLIEYEKFIDPGRRTDLYFSMANVYFITREHKMVNRYLNRIIKSKTESNLDKSLYAIAMVFQLVTMIESEDLILFKNRLTAARNYIRSKVGSEWLLQLCDFISLSENYKYSDKNKSARTELGNKLIDQTQSDPVLKRYLAYFDLVSWIRKLV